jgi:hypothetical protein
MSHFIRCWKYGKWSWKFERCLWCGTNSREWKHRHKGHGLCINCFDKKRMKKENRKLVKLKASRKYHLKKKQNPNYKIIRNEKARRYRETLGYRKTLKKAQIRNRFIYFLTKQHKFDKRHKGIEILIEGQRIKTPIQKPKGQSERELEKKMHEVKVFQEVYKKYILEK